MDASDTPSAVTAEAPQGNQALPANKTSVLSEPSAFIAAPAALTGWRRYRHLRRLIPAMTRISGAERIRSAVGALIGILVTGLLCSLAVRDGSALPALIAPMGASAVLLFAVPASPLAQPWSILGGNFVAAVIGVTAASLLPNTFVAAAVACGGAIVAMMALRCLHPPSGAVALTAVLGGPAIHELGFGFVLWPVGINSLVIVAVALLYNNLTGRSYPHVPPRTAAGPSSADRLPAARHGIESADLDSALKDFDQLLDIDRGDLEAILRRAQTHSYLRRSNQTTCADIMSRDAIAIAPHASLGEALNLLRRHHIKMLPVTDTSARVIGIVTQTDLLDKASWNERGPRLGLGRRWMLTLQRGRAPHGSVEDIMTRSVEVLRPETPIARIVMIMSDTGLHHLPVVGADDRLVGIVSQTDVVAALLSDATRHAGDPPRAYAA